MKKAGIVLLLGSLLFFSCKKFIEKQKQNALEDMITNGTWIVTRYLEDTIDITSSFSGYVFQFKTDGTVTGTKEGSSVNGVWSGDVDTRTINSNFPSAGEPVNKLNSVWKIKDSYPDSVAASTTINSNTNILNLHKQ
jgi:hypothetical protein